MTSHNKLCLLLLSVLLLSVSLLSVESVQAQNVTRFTSYDVFEIPAVNGSIRFSGNGTYASAVLEGDMWVFNNLTLSGSRFSGVLKFSAKNCNVTIHVFRSNAVRYTVEGVGEQVVNLGLNSSRPTHISEWSVINQDSVFFAEGKNWQLSYDNTLVVQGLLGTLTVVYYNYDYHVDDRPFYLRHSVIILTGVMLAVTVAIALVIKLRTVQGLS
ncbi:MAG: hypothetical protein FWD52_07685 [Candidatus Bathyarchaeota archaeon]|nr:hypothetical protein [Candidatus Termiticorpusculum sp.]